jgi:hypothetical protein
VLASGASFLVAASPPDFTLPIFLYGLLVLGLFAAAWLYYDRRDRALYDAQRRKISFHCIRCNLLYVERAGTETAGCPRCQHNNVRLKF